MSIEDIKFDLQEFEVDNLFNVYKEMSLYNEKINIQKLIFSIEEMYLDIKNLGGFSYEVSKKSQKIIFDFNLHKDNGKVKDNHEDVALCVRKFKRLNFEVDFFKKFNLFEGIKRKNRFKVYEKIVENSNFPELKKMILLLKNEKPLSSLKAPPINVETVNINIDNKNECFEKKSYLLGLEDIDDYNNEIIFSMVKKKLTRNLVGNLMIDLMYYEQDSQYKNIIYVNQHNFNIKIITDPNVKRRMEKYCHCLKHLDEFKIFNYFLTTGNLKQAHDYYFNEKDWLKFKNIALPMSKAQKDKQDLLEAIQVEEPLKAKRKRM